MKSYDYSSSKSELRRVVQQRIRALGKGARERASAIICEHLVNLRELSGLKHTVLLYAALPLEASLWEIIHRCPQHRYCLPRIAPGASTLECREFHSRETDLKKSEFGVYEPIPSQCPIIPLSEFDLALVPGLAFTADGKRLGRGGGFYDRLLGHKDFKAQTIGTVFACQVMPEIPMEEHDKHVGDVLTENGLASAT